MLTIDAMSEYLSVILTCPLVSGPEGRRVE